MRFLKPKCHLLSLLAWTLLMTSVQAEVRLQQSFGDRENQITAYLITQISGADSAAIYQSLAPTEKATFLQSYWKHHNPLLLKYYYGYHLGHRQYTVSDAYFERGKLIYPFFYRESPAPNKTLVSEGAQLCQEILNQNPDDAVALCGLGYFKLEQDSIDVAGKLFRSADRKQKRFLEARNGRALALLKTRIQKLRAKELFEEVASIDKEYAAAWYNAGMTYLATDGQSVIGQFEKVIKRFPDHPDAFFKLGACYERIHQPQKALEAYVQQLKVNPDHRRALFCATRAATELLWEGEGWPSIPGFEQALKDDPKRFLPFLGEMHLKLRDYEKAHQLYMKYLTLLTPTMQTMYRDITLIIDHEQRKALKEKESYERSRFVKAFWQDRNPTPTSLANPRELEHYRRVHYALLNFAEGADPWDRRGETYIQFGHPDHRTWSDKMVMETDPEVIQIKSLLNDRISNTPGAMQALQENNLAAISSMGPRGRPTFPTAEQSKWASWIYAKVGRGIEINFVDQFNNFHYEYIEVPPLVRNWTFWKAMSSQWVVEYVTAETPSVFNFAYEGEALPVHYATADFRSDNQNSAFEIYIGAEWTDLHMQPVGENSCAQVDWVAVLYDQDMNPVFRDSSQTMGCLPGDTHPTPGTLLIDQIRADINPGKYLMGLEIRDHNAQKVQYFRDSVHVESYNQTDLALSDIELASKAEETENHRGQFIKGNIQVVPMPSYAFKKGQPVYLYYEIYNLTRDDFGQTNYQIEYTLRGTRRSTAVNILRGIGQATGLTQGSGEFKMAYDHKGQDTWESIYIALENIRASKKDVMEATVQITDFNAEGKPSISKKARFVLRE